MTTHTRGTRQIDVGLGLDYEAAIAAAAPVLARTSRAWGHVRVETPTQAGFAVGGPMVTGSRVIVRGRRGALLADITTTLGV